MIWNSDSRFFHTQLSLDTSRIMSFVKLPAARSVIRTASLRGSVRYATTTTSSSSATAAAAAAAGRVRSRPEQKMNGLTAAGLGLAALLGWSAVILSVEGRRTPSGKHVGQNETVHHVAEVVKDKVEGECENGTRNATQGQRKSEACRSSVCTGDCEDLADKSHAASKD